MRGKGYGKRVEGGAFQIYPIYLHLLSHTFINLYIPSYTSIYSKISNFKKMKVDVRHSNCHNSYARASPRVRIGHIGSYHVLRGFATSREFPNQLKYAVLKCFGVVIQVHNPINKALCTRLVERL